MKGAKGKIKARGAGGAKGKGTTQGPKQKQRRGAKEAGKAGRDTAATPPQDDAPALGSALLRHKTGQSAGSCCYKAHLKKHPGDLEGARKANREAIAAFKALKTKPWKTPVAPPGRLQRQGFFFETCCRAGKR